MERGGLEEGWETGMRPASEQEGAFCGAWLPERCAVPATEEGGHHVRVGGGAGSRAFRPKCYFWGWGGEGGWEMTSWSHFKQP